MYRPNAVGANLSPAIALSGRRFIYWGRKDCKRGIVGEGGKWGTREIYRWVEDRCIRCMYIFIFYCVMIL